MPEPYQLMAAKWWRFSRYQIRDGSIGPVPGAELEEYDPWEEFEASRRCGVGRSSAPAYQSFVRLDQRVSFATSALPRADGEQAVLTWCERYGLLGLLLQRLDHLPAGSWDYPKIYSGPGKVGLLLGPVHKMHKWAAGHWNEESVYGYRRDAAWVEDVAQYFPGSRLLKARYPEVPYPLSPEFWAAYREPIGEFMRRALFLSDALKCVLSMNSELPHDVGPTLSDPVDTLLSDIDRLNELTGSVAPILQLTETGTKLGLKRQWAFRSLLACMAMMIQRDLLEGGRVFLCENCGTPFMSSSPKARYCEPKCRNTAQKRHQRENRKSKREGENMT